MSSVTLRTTCIEKTTELLRRGRWNSCAQNPFSLMPNSIVQDLLASMCPAKSSLMRASIYHSRLLLTSGRLEHVALDHAGNEEMFIRLFQLLSLGCQSLRSLSVLCDVFGRGRTHMDAEQSLTQLLRRSRKLEHLHSCIYFEPSSLRHCKNLKSLRLHLNKKHSLIFCRRITPDLLKRLVSLQVFAHCLRPSGLPGEDELRLTRMLLDNCPQMTSLGFLDSASALEQLHNRDVMSPGIPCRFQLRRCYWDVGPRLISQSDYCNRIRLAALSCPLVEVVVMKVRHPGCLQGLTALKNLNTLHIDFYILRYDFELEFYSVLEEMGPRLHHLSVSGIFFEPFSLNVVCRYCPNLNTLQLDCEVTFDEGVQPCPSFLNLKYLSLRVECYDEKSIFSLLANCLHLKVLCLDYCRVLGDDAMQTILRKNPFAELEVALIRKSSLSESCWRSLLQSAVMLRLCCLGSYSLRDDDAVQCARDLNPTVVCHSRHDFYNILKANFPLHMDSLCWL